MNLPFSPAAERNKGPLLEALRPLLSAADSVLEIGAGTGQHACHLAAALPVRAWHPTETPAALPLLQHALEAATHHGDRLPDNLAPALALDVRLQSWPPVDATVCFSANTLHIMAWDAVVALFDGAGALLPADGRLLIYGPYRFSGMHISDGNRRFDRQLRDSGSGGGLRDVSDLDRLALSTGFCAARQRALPSNNHLLVWHRR